ncbi:MAG TPA: carbon-nitrogen hydrolase family protein [Puia sp.]|nr:carbon-nitrogen hydrolase family protein [Puia sp.]
MKICIAQIKPAKGDMATNIGKHKKLISLAITYEADAIFFPELSVTGYEPKLAKELATNQADSRFDEFQDISNTNKITIGLGVPVNSDSGIKISMLIFIPGCQRLEYSKQQLHDDELPYFINGIKQIILVVAHKKIAPAICYESLQPGHSENAYQLGAEIYIASVAKSQKGVDKAYAHYPAIAKKYTMPVLMSNCIGFCDNFQSMGKSAVWTKNGNLSAQLDDKSEGIIVFDTNSEKAVVKLI